MSMSAYVDRIAVSNGMGIRPLRAVCPLIMFLLSFSGVDTSSGGSGKSLDMLFYCVSARRTPIQETPESMHKL